MISGGSESNIQNPLTSVMTIVTENETLSSALRAFWQSEEIRHCKILTAEEQAAEEHFVKTVKRCDDGKYMVKLPFKNDPSITLGDSFFVAQRRYEMIQKRLGKNPDFQKKYDQCIQQYLDLHHMEEAPLTNAANYYMPHHPVINESSSTTKIRPVFDASCKTTNDTSLNTELLIGPT